MKVETFSLPKEVAELAIDVADYANREGGSTDGREALLQRIEALIDWLARDPQWGLPRGLIEALAIGWTVQLGHEPRTSGRTNGSKG